MSRNVAAPSPDLDAELQFASGSWSVVSLIRAPEEYVSQFVSHYLRMGAERIFVFLDDPNMASIGPQQHDQRLEAAVCDEAFWAENGGRPIAIESRQGRIVRRAQQECATEWLLHVDVDELLFSTESVEARLATLEPDVFSALVRPIEAIYERVPERPEEVFATRWFKRNTQIGDVLRNVYGDISGLSRGGLFGHVHGKSFFRAAVPIKHFSVHEPRPHAANMKVGVPLTGMELLHYDAMTPDVWKEKFSRRLSGQLVAQGMAPKRIAQLQTIAASIDMGSSELLSLYKRMHVFPTARLAFPVAEGMVVERDLGYIAGASARPVHIGARSASGLRNPTTMRLPINNMTGAEYLKALNDTQMRVHWGQSGEDAVLHRMFGSRRNGFYVDIGAHHPRRFSNTYMFHRFREWRGLNVDASMEAIEAFRKERPNDVNVCALIGEGTEKLKFTEFTSAKARGSADPHLTKQAAGVSEVLSVTEMYPTPLAKLLDDYLPAGTEISLMNVDIEGFDLQALKTNDWTKYRPEVVCVEDFDYLRQDRATPIARFMVDVGYRCFSHCYDTSIYRRI
jgi:hypothetical protein